MARKTYWAPILVLALSTFLCSARSRYNGAQHGTIRSVPLPTNWSLVHDHSCSSGSGTFYSGPGASKILVPWRMVGCRCLRSRLRATGVYGLPIEHNAQVSRAVVEPRLQIHQLGDSPPQILRCGIADGTAEVLQDLWNKCCLYEHLGIRWYMPCL